MLTHTGTEPVKDLISGQHETRFIASWDPNFSTLYFLIDDLFVKAHAEMKLASLQLRGLQTA